MTSRRSKGGPDFPDLHRRLHAPTEHVQVDNVKRRGEAASDGVLEWAVDMSSINVRYGVTASAWQTSLGHRARYLESGTTLGCTRSTPSHRGSGHAGGCDHFRCECGVTGQSLLGWVVDGNRSEGFVASLGTGYWVLGTGHWVPWKSLRTMSSVASGSFTRAGGVGWTVDLRRPAWRSHGMALCPSRAPRAMPLLRA